MHFTNHLFGNIHILFHAWLASTELLQIHAYMLELFRFLGRGGIGALTERTSAGGVHASQGTFSSFNPFYFDRSSHTY